jgi:hypothetical protein
MVSGNVGVDWATQASHRLASKTVVNFLMDNGIKKMKLYDADYEAMKALGNFGIEDMVEIPNHMLQSLAPMSRVLRNGLQKMSPNILKIIMSE